jgi:phosphomannomutase
MKELILFDVDGTLTIPRNKINDDMISILHKLNNLENIDLGFVGGSDLSKQIEQLGTENLDLFKWKFTVNGLKSYYKSDMIHSKSIIEYIGENKYNNIINIILSILSTINIPKKRGNFIELRTGMINISPIGRSCTQNERDEFEEYDKEHNIRKNIIKEIKNKLGNDKYNYTFSIGGQISIDIFPVGWDKTYCLEFIQYKYDKIYFFGDKTMEGGNDYEIYNDSRIKGYSVNNYKDTIKILEEKFLNN